MSVAWGCFRGIEFQAPSRLGLRLLFEAFRQVHPGMFGQMLVMRLFRDEQILTQVCGNHFMVLKAAPPLMVSPEQLDCFVGSMARVTELIHSSKAFGTDALGLARRAVNI